MRNELHNDYEFESWTQMQVFELEIRILFSIQVSKVVHLITSMEVGRLSRRRGPQPYE
jgi:hypothetical protein